jgi:hypothetical protein
VRWLGDNLVSAGHGMWSIPGISFNDCVFGIGLEPVELLGC